MTLITQRLSDPSLTVAYREAGDGMPVVLIHGVGMQSATWTPQIKALSASHRVIAVDMPGHGGSTALPSGSKLPDFVDWFHEVISTLSIYRPAIAGHSMGALITLGYAVTYGHAADRVALINGVYRRDPEASAAVIARATQIAEGIVDHDTPLSRWFTNDPAEADMRAQVGDWLRAMDEKSYATAYGAFARGDATYADQLNKITGPFLALTGENDPNSTPAMSRDMAARVPNGRALILPGQRHMLTLTAADQVNAALLDWLRLPGALEATS